jgi:hypothetical protein
MGTVLSSVLFWAADGYRVADGYRADDPGGEEAIECVRLYSSYPSNLETEPVWPIA